MKNVVECRNLSFRYENEWILKDIHFAIQEGDFLGIIGPNGGGKTTLLKLILGLIRPTLGEIKVFGQDVEEVRPFLAYVPQYNTMDPDFPISAFEVVAMGVLKKHDLFPFVSKEQRVQILDTMRELKVEDLANRQFGDLSGGQRQRVLIARALVSRPQLLLLDEPTASVDPTVEEDIYELLFRLKQEMTLILVSHDLGFVSAYVSKVACVNRNLVLHRVSELSETEAKETYGGKVTMIHHHCHL